MSNRLSQQEHDALNSIAKRKNINNKQWWAHISDADQISILPYCFICNRYIVDDQDYHGFAHLKEYNLTAFI